MKKIYLNLLLLIAFICGATSAWAEDVYTIVYGTPIYDGSTITGVTPQTDFTSDDGTTAADVSHTDANGTNCTNAMPIEGSVLFSGTAFTKSFDSPATKGTVHFEANYTATTAGQETWKIVDSNGVEIFGTTNSGTLNGNGTANWGYCNGDALGSNWFRQARGGHNRVVLDINLTTKTVSYTVLVSSGNNSYSTLTGTYNLPSNVTDVKGLTATKQSYTSYMDNVSLYNVYDNAATEYTYTINYQFNGATVASIQGMGSEGALISAPSPVWNADQSKKYFATDNASTSFTISSADNTFIVPVREAETWTYSVNAVVGENNLMTISTNTVMEGETASYGYPQYIAKDGVLYKTTAQNGNPWWGKSFTPTDNNESQQINYSAEGTTGIVFCEEAENISTMTAVRGGNTDIRASNRAGAYSTGEGSLVTTLTPGKYKLSSALYGNTGTTITYAAGTSTILTLTTSGNPVHTTSEEFAVYENTDITVIGGNGGNSPKVVDYIYIQKTADLVETTYTINYTFEGNIITSENGTGYVGSTINANITSYTNPDTKQKYYLEEAAATAITIESENFVATIPLRQAVSDAVATVNAVDEEGNILKTFTAKGVEGESGTVFYSRIVESNGKFYDNGEKNAATVNYGTTAVFGGEPVEVVYTLDESITYYAEVEALKTSRKDALISRDAAAERSSENAWFSLYRSANAYIEGLDGGTYSITVSGRYFASSGESNDLNLIARTTIVDDEGNESQNETVIGTMIWTKGNNIEINTLDNITIPDDAMLVLQNPYDYNMNVSLDYIILRKNGTATLYAVDSKGNVLDAISTVSGQKGTTVKAYFPLMININGTYYKTEETPFEKDVEINSDDASANVIYTPDPTVVYYADSETAAGTNSNYSWGGTGAVGSQNYMSRGKSLGNFNPGVYAVYAYITARPNNRNLAVRGIPQNANPGTNTIGNNTENGYVKYGTISDTGLQSVANIVITETKQLIINGEDSEGTKSGQSADYDYIYVVQTEDFGGVSEPLPEISSVDGTSRTLKIGGGISDQENNVTTWYSLDNGTTWYNTDSPAPSGNGLVAISGDNTDITFSNQPGEEFLTFDGNAKTTQTVLTKSTMTVIHGEDELTIESDIVSIDVTYGEPWTLTGGFDVTDMVKDEDSSHTGGNGFGNGYGYYTPKIQVYVNTGVLPEADKDALNVSLTYLPYEYGSCTTQETKSVNLTKGDEINGKTYYTLPGDGMLSESGAYTLSITEDGYNDGTAKNSFYKGKYKITFKTIDFSAPDAIDNLANDEDGGYNGTWVAYDRCQDLSGFSNWNSTGYTDYYWNYSNKSAGTATMKDITSCVSAGSRQTYNFRVVQTSTTNPLILRIGYGLVKNLNKEWLYRVAQSHISNGNEIGLMVYNNGTSNDASDDVYDYQVPRISSKNIPEIDYLVPTAAAVKQYMVFTPVDVKTVTECGLSTYCSYYGTYLPADKYLDNDENYGAYYANKRTAYGTDYYLSRVWSVQKRTPVLIAHNNYYKQNIWEVDQQGMGATIEFRIINEGDALSGSKELVGYLSDGDVRNDEECSEGKSDGGYYLLPATGVYQYGYFNQSGNYKETAPNLILHSGTTYGVDCVNFYSMANSTDHARIYSRSAWLAMYTADYSTFNDENGGEGVKFFFDDELEGVDEGEATAINLVEKKENTSVINDNAYYTLTGMKLAQPTAPGIYIHNGKKIYVK